jgi:hypothetical protein
MHFPTERFFNIGKVATHVAWSSVAGPSPARTPSCQLPRDHDSSPSVLPKPEEKKSSSRPPSTSHLLAGDGDGERGWGAERCGFTGAGEEADGGVGLRGKAAVAVDQWRWRFEEGGPARRRGWRWPEVSTVSPAMIWIGALSSNKIRAQERKIRNQLPNPQANRRGQLPRRRPEDQAPEGRPAGGIRFRLVAFPGRLFVPPFSFRLAASSDLINHVNPCVILVLPKVS